MTELTLSDGHKVEVDINDDAGRQKLYSHIFGHMIIPTLENTHDWRDAVKEAGLELTRQVIYLEKKDGTDLSSEADMMWEECKVTIVAIANQLGIAGEAAEVLVN